MYFREWNTGSGMSFNVQEVFDELGIPVITVVTRVYSPEAENLGCNRIGIPICNICAIKWNSPM